MTFAVTRVAGTELSGIELSVGPFSIFSEDLLKLAIIKKNYMMMPVTAELYFRVGEEDLPKHVKCPKQHRSKLTW